MRKIRLFIAAILICAVCLSLCACGLKKSDAVGVWSGTYTYNGNQFSCGFVLDQDGSYAKITYKNGSLSSSETGTYEVKGGKVILHKDGKSGVSTEYKYKGGNLVNSGHKCCKG